MIGNDFIPCLPGLSIKNNGIDRLLSIYIDLIKQRKECLVYDGELNLQKEEIISGKFISIHEVKEMMQTKKFHPGGIETLNIYLGKKNIGQNKNETT